MGEKMKRTLTISALILSVLLVIGLLIGSTYSMFSSNNEMVTIRDMITNTDGTYNDMYYKIRNELLLTDEEVDLLVDSIQLNQAFNRIINDDLSEKEIYNSIILSVMDDDNIDTQLKDKIIDKANKYLNDIVNYMNKKRRINK